MERYTLEKHLKNICDDDYEFCNLHETWRLNKASSEKILKSVHINFPHYSLHDSSHSETIISNIEMLLGEDRIKQLSPTETWMILQCAYLHDLGMAITNKCLEEQWTSKEFKEYLEENKLSSIDNELIEAIKYIDNLSIDNSASMCTWPLKVRKYSTYIIADYFRGKHSSFTQEYIKDTLTQWNIDLSYNGLIKKRLIDLIGKISFLHTSNFDNVMKLDYISNGYRSDYIHPRFIAELLRLGDLLDTDNGRFDNFMEKINGELKGISAIHKKKHQSITQILVTPKKIELEADCAEEAVCRETKNWFEWIKSEINNLTMNWSDIVPNNLTGYAPKITKLKILLNGQEDVSGVTDLKFNISQEKAFDIIQGANIYNNRFIFVRELIQNALDASKIQLWRDLKNGLYDYEISDFLSENKELKELMPFHLKQEIYNRYMIDIDMKDSEDTKDNNEIEFIIKDRGTGISIESLKEVCNVGTSYKNRKKEIDEMPSWLRPTAGFGIGLQSIFLVNTTFELFTNYGIDNKSYKITFESRKSNGYITVREDNFYKKRGTEIHVKINKNIAFKDSEVNPNDILYIDSNNTVEGCILTEISNCKNNLFKIDVTKMDNIKKCYYDENRIMLKKECKFKEENDYYYFLSNDLSYIQIYTKEKTININISILNEFEVFNFQQYFDLAYFVGESEKYGYIHYYFKGIKLKGFEFNKIKSQETGIMTMKNEIEKSYRDYIAISIDILGENTKEYLTLDRKSIKGSKIKQISSLIDKSINLYLKKIIEEYKNGKKNYKFNECVFIMLCIQYLDDFEPNNFKDILDKINSDFKVAVLEKLTANKVEFKSKSLKDIINDYPNWLYIETKFSTRTLLENNELSKFIENKNINFKYIIVDDIFLDKISYLDKFKFCKVEYLGNLNKENIVLYSINLINKFNLSTMSDRTKNYYLNLLLQEKNLNNNKRISIPVIKEYETLAVKVLPQDVFSKNFNVHNIISPLTNDEINYLKNLSDYNNVNEFIDEITKKDSFSNLVNYTLKNKVIKDKNEFDDIANKYKQLIKECFNLIQSQKASS